MHKEVITFWFEDSTPEQWFSQKPDANFDSKIREKFLKTYHQAARGELFTWRFDPLGRLAEIIVLDQFPRNMFRGTAQAFASDNMALVLSQEAITLKIDKTMSDIQKSFLYMPHMHSESQVIHEVAMRLFDQKGLEENLKYEIMHKKIIDRFGRYPHRNQVLGRESTNEEIEFLKQPNSSF